jgi:hypothetical protein
MARRAVEANQIIDQHGHHGSENGLVCSILTSVGAAPQAAAESA